MKVGNIVEIFYKELNDICVSNIHNLRLSDIANLELNIAQPNSYFCDAMERSCSITAGSH